MPRHEYLSVEADITERCHIYQGQLKACSELTRDSETNLYGVYMTYKIAAFLFAVSTATSASAMSCARGEAGVILARKVVGTYTLDTFRHLDFSNVDEVHEALAGQKARTLAAGTLACQVVGDGFLDYAAHLKIPGLPVAVWVEQRALEPVE
jgi:hypothetical protein